MGQNVREIQSNPHGGEPGTTDIGDLENEVWLAVRKVLTLHPVRRSSAWVDKVQEVPMRIQSDPAACQVSGEWRDVGNATECTDAQI